MRTSSLFLSLVVAVALGGAARAQDGGLKPTDGGAPAGGDPVAPSLPQAPSTSDTPVVEGSPNKDPGNWKGSTPVPAPADVPQADPLLGGGAPAPAPAKDPNVIGNDDPRADKIIQRNYNEAIGIYENALKNEGESVDNLDHRIQVNEKLIADYKKRLAASSEAKRRLQVELFNRTFYLKQQRDKGAIPEDTFEKLMKDEEKKYNQKSAQAKSDNEFYEKEIAEAEKRLSELRAERRIHVTTTKTNQIAKNGGKKPVKPQTASGRVMTSLKDRLQKLAAWDTKHTMDNSPVCEPCMKPGAPPAPAPSEAPAEAAPQSP